MLIISDECKLLCNFIKIIEDIFARGYSDIFYKNDILVLIEVLLRHLNDADSQQVKLVVKLLSYRLIPRIHIRREVLQLLNTIKNIFIIMKILS